MAGQYAQGQATYTNAKYEQAAAKANEAMADQQAKEQIDQTKLAALRRYREAGQLEGQQKAAMAANGIDLGFGSAAEVQRDSRMIASEDVGQIYKEGFNRTQGYLTDAYNYRLRAKAARSAARAAGVATGIGMLGTALGGASQISRMSAASSFGG
jgi:phosphoglucomutase